MRANWLTTAAVVAFTARAAAQVYIPIPVTGYTQDVIADAGGTAMATTTASFDDGFNSVFFEQGYNTGGSANGLPSNGAIVTSATRAYQLGPINGNNSLRMTTQVRTGTLTLVAPTRDAALSLLLGASSGTATVVGTVTVNWSNGNSSNFTYVTYDWWQNSPYHGPAPAAIGGLNRVNRTTGALPSLDLSLNPFPVFAIYYYDIGIAGDANYSAGASVDSLSFVLPTSTDTLNIMGLSGSVTVPEPSSLLLTAAAAAGLLFRRKRCLLAS